MLIFKYARDGTLEVEGLKKIANTCDVSVEGVGGAKSFFEAKANEVKGLSVFVLQCLHREPSCSGHTYTHDHMIT